MPSEVVVEQNSETDIKINFYEYDLLCLHFMVYCAPNFLWWCVSMYVYDCTCLLERFFSALFVSIRNNTMRLTKCLK